MTMDRGMESSDHSVESTPDHTAKLLPTPPDLDKLEQEEVLFVAVDSETDRVGCFMQHQELIVASFSYLCCRHWFSLLSTSLISGVITIVLSITISYQFSVSISCLFFDYL